MTESSSGYMLDGGTYLDWSSQQEQEQTGEMLREEGRSSVSDGKQIRAPSQRIRQPPTYLRDYVTCSVDKKDG